MKGFYKVVAALLFVLSMMTNAIAQEVTVGLGTSTSQGDALPVWLGYYYSWTEQLYLADELQRTGEIHSISVQYYYGSAYTRNVTVYMGITPETSFSSYVPLSELTEVFSGEVTFTNANPGNWVTIELDTPFNYDGSGSLVVGFDDHTGSGSSWSNNFYTHYTGYYRSYLYGSYSVILPDYQGSGSRYTYRNNMKFLFANFNVQPSSLAMGDRPNGCWTETADFVMRWNGITTTVNDITHQNDYFTLNTPTVPFAIGFDPVPFTVTPGIGEGEQLDTIVVNWGDNKTCTVPVSANAYTPASPDVYELAHVVGSFPYEVSFTAGSNLHNDYRLPGSNSDGKDAVFKLTLPSDMELAVVTSGKNGKAALYHEDFDGFGGPMLGNGIEINDLYDFEEGNFNNGLNWVNDATYPWSFTQNNPHSGTYCIKSGNYHNSSTTSTLQLNIEFVTDGTVEFYSRISSESVSYDWGVFLIDDVEQYREGGSVSWNLHSFPVTAGQHVFTWRYRKDSSVDTGEDTYYIDDLSFTGAHAKGMTLRPGTYYVVASSTSDDFTVGIDATIVPTPDQVLNLQPANGHVIYDNQTSQELTWWLGNHTTEYQLLVGETNPPTTVAVDWTSDLANGYLLNLQNNKTYYWQVNERNTTGMTNGPVYALVTNMLAPSADNVFYVKQGGTGNKNGYSWDNASDNLSAVLDIASKMNVKPTVWVAQGTYYGDSIAGHNAFTMIPGVNVYGGFAGDENTLEARHGDVSILDGQHVQRVLYQQADFTDATAVTWDGFVLENGFLGNEGNGAGAYIRAKGTLKNSIIRNDSIVAISGQNLCGGGVALYGGTLENCEIYGNCAWNKADYYYNYNQHHAYGGGVYMSRGTIRSCHVHHNYAEGTYGYGYGGGVYTEGNSSDYCRSDNCRIDHNYATYGGGVYTHYSYFINNVISNNSASGSGGVSVSSYSYFVNCDIVNNLASSGTGGISSGSLRNCVVWGNKSGTGVSNISGTTLNYCGVEGACEGTANVMLSSQNNGEVTSPKFTQPTEGAGKDFPGLGDWTIQEGSFLINKGDNNSDLLPAFDLAGATRIQQETVDIGAYETPYNASFTLIPDENNVIYVALGGAGSKNGSSWANASDNLQLVMTLAAIMSPVPEVWVKEGVYVGDSIATSNAFMMTPGVNVYGGFAGTETELSQRDYASHPTILDGQRVQRVLRQSGTFTEEQAATWDGFIIQNGRVTSDHGAGAYLRQNGKLRNCIIRNDTISGSSTGSYYGAGVCMVSAALENCEVYGNYNSQGYYGGGVSMESYSTLTDCYIHDNRAYSSGGGIYARSGSTITRCRVIGNNGGSTGGGISASGGSGSNYITIQDCRIENNQSIYHGSGAYVYYTYLTNCIVANNALTTTNNNWGNYYYGAVYADGGARITNCLIVNNTANTSYAGLYCHYNSSNTMENTVIWGNRVNGQVSTIGTYNSGYLTASYCAIEGGYSGTGNFSLSSANTGDALSPMFTAPTAGAGLDYTGGDWTLQDGSVLVNRGNNQATYLPEKDIAGNDRIQHDIVDMGAYESPYEKSHDITPDANNVIYVTVEGAGSMDGSSWSNASNDLNLVMTMAALMDQKPEVWVKEGTYVGDSISGTSAFRMGQGVNVYGGFAGTETERDQRDFTAHPTILDGQHVQRVLEQPWSYTQATATEWDGFIIQNGRMYYGDGCGASVLSYGKLKNCIIRNNITMGESGNYGTGDGGGMYGYYATIENCEIYGNKVSNGTMSIYSEFRGGAAYLNSCTMINCYIHDNVAENNYDYGHTSGSGGGLYLRSTTVTGCTIINNTTTGYGGGVRAYDGSNILTNCRIENNTTRYSNGGGIYVDNTCTVTGCVIANNTAVDYGGGISANCITLVNSTVVNNLLTTTQNNRGAGIYTYSNNNVLTNNIIWGNMRNDVPDQYLFTSYTPTLTYCAIQGGYDGTGNITLSAENEGSELHPFFVHPTDSAGAAFSGGNWNLLEESFCINQGTNSISNITLPETDLAGNERIQMGAIDLGAYESPYNAVVITCDEHGIVYVTPTGAGNKDGSSWANASDNLQLAVNRAGACSFGADTRVWVAQGTYQGRSTESDNAFVMPQSIKVYGGFVGNEAYDYDLSQRDLVNHASILDGQGLQRVLFQRVAFTNATTAVWDGFSITNGGGSYAGAGTYLRSYGELRNCRIYNNVPAGSYTAGVCAEGGALTNCHIYNNQGYNGGVYASSATLTNCLVEGNTGTSGAGGIYINTYTTLLHCGIYNNTVTGNGTAGMYVSGSNGNVMRNTVVWGNNGAAISNPGYISVYYSAIEGGIVGTGNINLSLANTGEVMSPCFTDPASGDWTLQSNSILINKGVTLTDHPATDLAGNDRVQQEVPDMGPFESAHTAAFDIVPDANGIVYVRLNGTGDGSSWANACGDLQFAVNRAGTMDPVPAIWVAEGVYTTLLNNTTSSFYMIPGVNVYGGFAGTETTLEERNWQAHQTILDGEGTHRVLYQRDNFTASTQATWDGFTIRNGYTGNEKGAGVYMRGYSNLKNCVVKDNESHNGGGGIYGYGYVSGFGNSSIVNCKVMGNSVTSNQYGSGIYVEYCKVINCEVSNNTGGTAGVHNYCSEIINTTIVNNTNSTYGGLYCNTSTSYQMTNLIIWGNGSGGQFYNSGGNITYSAIQAESISGTGNIALNADNDGEGEGNYIRFLAPEFGIYQLKNNSSVINMANTEVTDLPEKDMAGRDRLLGEGMEPGAYEQYCTEVEHLVVNTCSGYNFYGSMITEPGTYIHQYSYSETCDSLIIADVTITSSVFYVTETGAGNRSGSSWSNASNDLNYILERAALATGYESRQVWVAQGDYTGNATGTSYLIVGGVEVYGGFTGNETELSQRNPGAHPVILQGEVGRVLLAASTTYPCTEEQPGFMDGFRFRYGEKALVSDHITMKDCEFRVPVVATNCTLKQCEIGGVQTNSQNVLQISGGAVMDSCKMHFNVCSDALMRAENAIVTNTLFYNNTINRSNNSSGINGIMFGAVVNAIDNVIIDHCDILNNREVYTGQEYPEMFVNMEGSNALVRQPIHTVIALHNSTLRNSIIWGNEQGIFSNTFIAKDQASDVNYCAMDGGLVNGIGNISLENGNSLGTFAVAFQNPIIGAGHQAYIFGYNWNLRSNSICLKHGSDGSDIGVYSSTDPATIDIQPSAGNVIYVDADGSGDGSSWNNATSYLQFAVARANTFEPAAQVWVKEGTYTGQVSDSLLSAFVIMENVNVYGGFAGTETTLDERDIENHPTILDGQNKHRVLYQNESFDDEKAAVWDGFVIRNGFMKETHFYEYNSSIVMHPYNNTYNWQYDLIRLHGAGAALMGNFTLRNTCFENNRIARDIAHNNGFDAIMKGTALSVVDGTLDHVTIAYDTTEYVGADNSMLNTYLYAINAQINNCDFNHNIGKIALYGCEVNCTRFESNQVRVELPETDNMNEAQLYVDASTIKNCHFNRNNAVVINRLFANAQHANTFINCQIDHNNALAVVNHKQSYNDTFINCNVCDNKTLNTGTVSMISGGIFHNSVIWGNKNYANQPIHFGSVGDCSFNHTAVELGVDGADGVITIASNNRGTSTSSIYPCFLAPDAADYELTNESGLIDQGDASIVTVGEDIMGNPRINDGSVDVGAYEYKCILYREYNAVVLPNIPYYPFYGQQLTESGQYVHRWHLNNVDCDSVVVLNLTFKHIIYVTEEGGGLRNGTSWENAYGDLRVACEAAGQNPLDKTQIWVAEGLYRGDGTSVNAFQLYPNVELYGGLTGTELANYDLSQRDIEHHVTTLDGDYIQRVIYMMDDCTEETACVIDGFTIKNGYSRQDVNLGTALYLKRYCHVRNCIITENYTWSGVGAIFMHTDDINSCEEKIIFNTFENCEIVNNQGSYAVLSDHALFRNCKISGNQGRGMYVVSYTKLDHCELESNGGRAVALEGAKYSYKDPIYWTDKSTKDYFDMDGCLVANNAGGLFFIMEDCKKGHSETNIVNCVFDRNKLKKNGDDTRGGAIFGSQHDINIVNSTFLKNEASADGGALYGVGYHIVNSVFSGNKAAGESNQFSNHYYQVVFCEYGNVTWVSIETSEVRYSAIEGGYPGEGNICLNNTDMLMGLNNYVPTINSVCINSGTTEGITVPEYDRAGNSRVQNGRIDIGAYESDKTTERVLIAPDANNIIYVSADGTGNGSSWENATKHLQMALNFALCHDPKPQIWVKAGNYDYINSENRQFWSSLAMMPGVNVYGGFAGNEPANYDLDQRDLSTNRSILDAEQGRRVIEQFAHFEDDDVVTWDGFYIKNGYARDGYTKNIKYLTEGAIEAYFKDYMNGGGVLLRGGGNLSNCEIYNNIAFKGGGIYREGSRSLYADYLLNNKIRHNYALEEGGGLFFSGRGYGPLYGYAPIDTIANCEISNNHSDRHGGFIAHRANFIGCSVIHNNTELYSFDTITSSNVYNRFVNCVLWGNESRNYPFQTEGSNNTYLCCAIQGGHEGTGNITLSKDNTGPYGAFYPHFLDPDEEIYRITTGSDLIDRGYKTAVCGDLDLARQPRVKNGWVDMGAYEETCLNYEHRHVIANRQYDFYGHILRESGRYEHQWRPEGMDCDSLVSLDLEIRSIWFVKQGGTGDGSSWANAMGDLNGAILSASQATDSIGSRQVWVAKGVYTGNGISEQAFTLRPGVEIYGGFKGNEDSGIDFSERDLANDTTVLDGSHCQRVLGNMGIENSFSPIQHGYIDGFVIRNGYTTGNGGGIYAKNYIDVKNCVIKNNQGGNGAGVYLENHSDLTKCEIFSNTALNDGGGAYVSSSSLTHCNIHNNLCDNVGSGLRRGGGIYGINATINNCLIYNNSALTSSGYGGGMYIGNSEVPSQLLNCTMVNNYSYYLAGGIYSENSGSNNEFINCVLWGNRTDLNTQQIAVSASNVPIYLRYCAVQGGAAGIGTITLTAENAGDFGPNFTQPTANVGANYYGSTYGWMFGAGSILANHGERDYEVTIEEDLYGNERIRNGRIDIGAYESNTNNDYMVEPDYRNVIYVKLNCPNTNLSGDSWINAIPDLQMAINFAGDHPDRPAIWIAEGTYTGNGWPYVDAFVAMNGVNLYGGFAGYEINFEDRHGGATILDGQNIQRTLQQAQENYFKYRKLEELQYAIYDGLTIRNGFVYHNNGAGVMMYSGKLYNCTIEGCHALNGNGGGLYAGGWYDVVDVVNTSFLDNKSENGNGGAANLGAYANIKFRNCLIANNSALNGSGGGVVGGTHYNSTIVNNYATIDAGGTMNVTMYNSVVWGNKAGDNIPCNFNTMSLNMANPFSRSTVKYSAIEGGYYGEGNITLGADNGENNSAIIPNFSCPSIAAGAGYAYVGPNNTLPSWKVTYFHSILSDHGNNAYAVDTIPDLAGDLRFRGNVDIGCYESYFGNSMDIHPDANNIIYVTPEGAGSKDGSSWDNATPYVQFALERSELYSPRPVIWMAKGTYTGDGVTYFPAFRVPDGISIYGGFEGNEPANFDLTQRDFDQNITIMDGQNMQQIMRHDMSGGIHDIISGITFRNGRALRDGGAADLNYCQIEDCKFLNNTSVNDDSFGGGALHVSSCNIFRSEFRGNYAMDDGGAINISGGTIDKCLITNNTTAGNGGGITGSCYLYNSEISFNHADGLGGGIHGAPEMRNCDVVRNTVNAGNDNAGGGLYVGKIDNGFGGSVYNYMTNNIIWGNRAGALVNNIRGSKQNPDTFTYMAVENDDPKFMPEGTGNIVLETSNDGSNPSLYYVRFEDPNGDFRLGEQSMCIDAGNGEYGPQGEYGEFDFLGNPRVANEHIDIGCYEHTPVNCHVPTELAVPLNTISFTSAYVYWTPGGDETEWIVYLIEVDGDTPILKHVTVNRTTFIDLLPNREYMVKVRAVCDNDEMSSYTVPVYFTTACDPDAIVWTNYLETDGMMPLQNDVLPSNSTVLFNWDYITGADYYELYLWRTDHGNGLEIPDFPIRSNLHVNYASVNLAASNYDNYGVYDHCFGSYCDPEPPVYLYQYDTTGVAYYAWYVVAHKDCSTIQSDTMYFNTGLPDLHVTALDCSYAQTGQLMTVQWSVRNDGTVATPTGATWNDYIVLSYPVDWTHQSFLDPNPESYIMATVPNLIALDTNMQYTNQCDIFIRDDMYGSVFLFVLSNWSPNSSLNLDFAPYGGVFPNPYTPDPSGYPYYYMSGTCSSQSFAEINECDNFFYKQIEVDIPPYPDLIVRDVTFDPPVMLVGDTSTISVSWNIINQGRAGFEDVVVTDVVYLSTDTVFNSTDITLGTFVDTLTMAIGDTVTRTARFLPEERNLGTYYFFVLTDVTNAVYESLFEGNNLSPASNDTIMLDHIPMPDIMVDNMDFEKREVSPNEWFGMSYTVKNVGNGDARPNVGDYGTIDTCGQRMPVIGARWTDRIYLSEERDTLRVNMATYVGQELNDTILYTPSQIVENNQKVRQWAECKYSIPDTLSANASHEDSVRYANLVAHANQQIENYCAMMAKRYINQYTRSFRVRMPEVIAQEGMYYYYLYADADDVVFEQDDRNGTSFMQRNNILVDSVEVVLPDLQVLAIELNDTRDSVKCKVKNIGRGKMLGSDLAMTVNFNNAQVGDTVYEEQSMNPGDVRWLVSAVDIPCNFYVSNSIKVTVEPWNDRDFTNNNLVIQNYQIPNPDFTADNLDLNSTSLEFNSGETVHLEFDMYNEGFAEYDGKVKMGVYLGYSPELNFYTAEQLLRTDYPVHLPAGTGSQNIDLYAPLPIEAQGTYYLYVVLNDGDSICEGDNVHSNYLVTDAIDVSLSPYPDLYIYQAELPANVTAGSTQTVKYWLRNDGIRDISNDESWYDAVYISNSPQFDPETATQLTMRIHDGPLAIGETCSTTYTFYDGIAHQWITLTNPYIHFDVTIPYGLPSDNYFFYIVTDDKNDLFEYVGEYNNVYQSAPVALQAYDLDLAVTTLSVPDTVLWDQKRDFTYCVRNKGSMPTVSSFTDKLFLSTDTVFDGSDLELVSNVVNGLNGNAVYQKTLKVTIPYGYEGDYYILAVTDVDGDNPDINPMNNVRSRKVYIKSIPVPDLMVSDVEILTAYPACGQPVQVRFKVTNVGTGPTYGTYYDRALYSRNTYENGTLIENITRDTVLNVNEYYYDTVSFVVPVPATGNYAVYIKANHNEKMYEPDYENNLALIALVVNLNAPGDLVVPLVHVYQQSVVAGNDIDIMWKVRNNGPNELTGGGYSEVIYLSKDAHLDSDDKLLGNITYEYFDPSGLVATGITFPLYTDITHTLKANISGVQEGYYYIIVVADARNVFYETNEDNNRGHTVTPLHVTLPVLPFNTPVEFDMVNYQYKDFRLEVGDNISETVRIWVTSSDAEMGSVNNIYVLKDAVGSNLEYDFSSDGQMTSNSEVYIPRTEDGYYGVSVLGYTPLENPEQHMTIEADILPFEVRDISPNYGGNNGKVTVKLVGSKFRFDMEVELFKYIMSPNGNDTLGVTSITADTLYYVNFNEVFVTFDLTGAEEGVYSLRAYNYCAGYAYLNDCFTVLPGEAKDNLATNLIIPAGLRPNRYCCLTLEYGNIGLTDIVNPTIRLASEGGCYIGLSRGELNIHRTELDIPIPGAPQGILRPGERHTVTIYCYTNAELHFYIFVNEEIEIHEYVKNVMQYGNN